MEHRQVYYAPSWKCKPFCGKTPYLNLFNGICGFHSPLSVPLEYIHSSLGTLVKLTVVSHKTGGPAYTGNIIPLTFKLCLRH